MIRACEAKEMVENSLLSDGGFLINSIHSCIMNGIANEQYHCDWKTPQRYNCSKEEIKLIEEEIKWLDCNGYYTKLQILPPNDLYPNWAVKVHISWE